MYIITKEEAYRRALDVLQYQLRKYVECKYTSEHGTKVAKNKASKEMRTHAEAMLQALTSHPEVRAVVLNGHPFQFEDFSQFAASDVPGYIDKIQKALDELID